jgi:hypothetical protein
MSFLQTEASRERWAVRVAVGAFVVASVSGLFSFMQWKAADKAASVAEQARKDALTANVQQRLDAQETLKRQQAESDKALKIQSDSAVEAYKLAARSAKAGEMSAEAAREQLRVSRDQATSAKNSAEAVQLQMRLDQRAWVTVDVGEKTGNFAVTMKNAGKSPAINVTEVTAFAGGKRMGPPDVDLSENSSSSIPLPPNAPKEFLETLKKEGYIRDHPPTGYVIAPGATQIASDYQGKFTQIFRIEGDRVYVQGRVTYDDVFGHAHETIFCYWFAPPSDFVMCNDHNRMN